MSKKGSIWLLVILAVAASTYGQHKQNNPLIPLPTLQTGTPIERIEPIDPIAPIKPIEPLPSVTLSPPPLSLSPLSLFPMIAQPQLAGKPAWKECSKQADAKGLHGIERRNFRAQCKAEFRDSLSSAADVPQLKPVNSPQTGAIERGRRRNAIAPFAIETEPGTNYLIKLVKVDNKKDFIRVFVRGGETYSTKLPVGTYNIRAAAGLIWYGPRDFFGPSSHFFRMRNKDGKSPTFDFYRQGNKVYGMKLSLRKVVEGNMEEEPISRDEF